MGLMFAPLKRFFDFSGRSRRKELWLWYVVLIVVYVVAMILDVKLGLGGSSTGSSEYTDGNMSASFNVNGGILTLGWMLITLIPNLALSIRRMHDQDRSGWWILVPIAGAIMVLFIGGTAGPNRFGPDPKGRGMPIT